MTRVLKQSPLMNIIVYNGIDRTLSYQCSYLTNSLIDFRLLYPGWSSGYPSGVKAIGSTLHGNANTSRAASGLNAPIQHVPSPRSAAARIRWSIALVTTTSQ